MNYPRIVVAAVVATLVDMAYGFLVWGMVLNGEFSRYENIFRPADDLSALPLMAAGIFVGMLFAAWIFAKGREGGSGLKEGLMFGLVMGLFMGAYMSSVNYGIMRIGKKMALTFAGGSVGEWVLVGLTIGLLYKPVAGAAKRAAGV